MESEIYSEEDDDFFQQTTVEESCRESFIDTKFKKLFNSNTDISNISSIYRLELEDGIKESEFLKENKIGEKNNKYESKIEEKNKKESEEESQELGDDLSEKELKEKDEDENSEETFGEPSDNKKNYTFIWNEGGNEVKITGSFSDWKIQFPMIKDSKGQTFKCQLPLNNEIYQYKFIVDGQWRCSKSYPTKEDGNGNLNNVLDNTKNVSEKEQKEEKNKKQKNKTDKNKKSKTTKKRRISNMTKTAKTRASTINKEKIIRNISIYKSEYPSDDDILPLPLPNKRYFESFKLENYSNQKSIGNEKYYDYYGRYCFSFEASSKPIFILGHINLNHLISVKQNNKSNIIKNSMSFRYREKASTFIYYK